MSTLNVANVTDGTTTVGTSFVVGGIKAHWFFDQENGNILRNSMNISGIVDNGTGDMTASFSTSFTSLNNYSATAHAAYQNNNSAGAFRGAGSIVRAAGSFRFTSVYISATNGSASYQDNPENSWHVCGDLA